MKNDINNFVQLTEPEIIWLREAYHNFIKVINVTRRFIKIKLLEKLPPSFDPLTINSLLLRNGNDITLAGILYIDPDSTFLTQCDKFVNYIKTTIKQDPYTNEIQSKDISDNTSIPETDITKVINKLNEFGRFSSGYSMSENKIKTISVGEDEVYDEYLNYDSIRDLIMRNITNKSRSKYNENATNQVVLLGNKYNPIFKSSVSQIDKNLCFVIMPFSETWSERVYLKLIRPAVEGIKLQCLRADNLSGPIVIEDIWIKINQSAFIIADVTNKNPNVMYELGIVHAIGKPAILITQDISQIPFDFTHLRHYEYKDNLDGFEKLSKELPNIIRSVYFENYKLEI